MAEFFGDVARSNKKTDDVAIEGVDPTLQQVMIAPFDRKDVKWLTIVPHSLLEFALVLLKCIALALIVSVTITNPSLISYAIAGVAIGFFNWAVPKWTATYALKRHLNPIYTIAYLSVLDVGLLTAAGYWALQLGAGVLAGLCLREIGSVVAPWDGIVPGTNAYYTTLGLAFIIPFVLVFMRLLQEKFDNGDYNSKSRYNNEAPLRAVDAQIQFRRYRDSLSSEGTLSAIFVTAFGPWQVASVFDPALYLAILVATGDVVAGPFSGYVAKRTFYMLWPVLGAVLGAIFYRIVYIVLAYLNYNRRDLAKRGEYPEYNAIQLKI